jgi:hypothetical protein
VRRSSAAAQTTETLVELKRAEKALVKALQKGPVSPRDLQEVHEVLTADVATAIRALKAVEPAVDAPAPLPKPAGDADALLAQIAFLKAELAAARATAAAGPAKTEEPEIDLESLPEPRKSKVILERQYSEKPAFIAALEAKYSAYKDNTYKINAYRKARGNAELPIPETLLQFYLMEKQKIAPKPVAPEAVKGPRVGQKADPCERPNKDEDDAGVEANFDYWNSWVGAANIARRNAIKKYISSAAEIVETNRQEALDKLRDPKYVREFGASDEKLIRYFNSAVIKVQSLSDYARVILGKLEAEVRANNQRKASIILENLTNTRECMAKIILDSSNAKTRMVPPVDFERAPRKAVAAPAALAGLFGARGPPAGPAAGPLGGPAAAGAGAPSPPRDPRAALLANLRLRAFQ